MDIVLLHAFPVDSRMWAGVPDAITPDQHGRGRSPDLAHAARDVLAGLDARGVDRFLLGGCSMGGYVAMALLCIAPERIAGLVLADTRAGADTDEARVNRLAMASRVETEGVGDWLADAVLPGLLSANATADAVAATRRMVLEQNAVDVAWAQRAMAARPDSRELLARTDIPALVVVGEQDTLTPPSLAREMADLLPTSTLRILPGAGHLSPVEAPALFAHTVREWLAELS